MSQKIFLEIPPSNQSENGPWIAFTPITQWTGSTGYEIFGFYQFSKQLVRIRFAIKIDNTLFNGAGGLAIGPLPFQIDQTELPYPIIADYQPQLGYGIAQDVNFNTAYNLIMCAGNADSIGAFYNFISVGNINLSGASDTAPFDLTTTSATFDCYMEYPPIA